jgi:uncharacterized protein (TIGR02001 family)
VRALALAALGSASATRACAQMASRVSLQSNYEIRGISITGGRPVGGLDLSYDFTSGVFLNGSAFGALSDHDHPGLAGFIGDAGYARRLGPSLSADAGVTRTEYVGIGKDGTSTGYTEIYAGLAWRHLSARLYYSPDYYRSGAQTLYGELAGNIGLAAGIRLNAHIGALGYLKTGTSGPENYSLPNYAVQYYTPQNYVRYDWLVGASRQFGAVDVHMSLSGGGPNAHDHYDPPEVPRYGTVFILGMGYTY